MHTRMRPMRACKRLQVALAVRGKGRQGKSAGAVQPKPRAPKRARFQIGDAATPSGRRRMGQ